MRSPVINQNLSEPLFVIIDNANDENIHHIDKGVNLCSDYEVQPVFIRKQPKFPTRERHLAIRRKKSYANKQRCAGECEK